MITSARPRFYRLVGKLPVPFHPLDLTEAQGQAIADTDVGGLHVSTFFLGVDVSPHLHGDPILFETKIFGNQAAPYQTRCSTWSEAEAMHQAGVVLAAALNASAVRPPRRCPWIKRQVCRFVRGGSCPDAY